MSVEDQVAKFVKKRGVNLSAMSRGTGISYMSLYDSLFNKRRSRNLKADELIAIAKFLGVDITQLTER